jgi:cell shape-determining protein MreD
MIRPIVLITFNVIIIFSFLIGISHLSKIKTYGHGLCFISICYFVIFNIIVLSFNKRKQRKFVYIFLACSFIGLILSILTYFDLSNSGVKINDNDGKYIFYTIVQIISWLCLFCFSIIAVINYHYNHIFCNTLFHDVDSDNDYSIIH